MKFIFIFLIFVLIIVLASKQCYFVYHIENGRGFEFYWNTKTKFIKVVIFKN